MKLKEPCSSTRYINQGSGHTSEQSMVLHCSSFNFSYSLYLLQQAHSDIISGRLPSSEQEARLFAATKCQFDLGDFDPAVSIEDKL